ncbi:CTP synthetase [Salipiger sp. P9]|uniref:CTP synthetase n=1 Tax=Salipiger pentaromativorans TaxID=2943193 RepID=UPI00215760E2|nr:CTP synthetase [Salipiger pentaromativorans]MCR8550668.1 CTP synthetase [Salipiger pentaromativorans]
MLRLAGILYSLIGTTFAGSFMIAALVMGHDTLIPVVASALAGFVVGLPVTWYVTKAIYSPS